MATQHHSAASHAFTNSWRWPTSFETWVRENLPEGKTLNVAAGLSPVGDVRVDLQTPAEIINSLDDDDRVTDHDVREVAADVIAPDAPLTDPVRQLLDAETPHDCGAKEALDTAPTIRADIFKPALPLADDAFSGTVADPPWKDLTAEEEQALVDELVRVTKPGGTLMLNAWFLPTHRCVTIDEVFLRADTDRHQHGTPSASFAAVATVHASHAEAVAAGTVLSPGVEHCPDIEDFRDRAAINLATDLHVRGNISPEAVRLTPLVDDTTACPQCGETDLRLGRGPTGLDLLHVLQDVESDLQISAK
ncbi:hypothetical protein RYH80_18350 [Halobaculum sp. MBLA0147]|uniref:hypothetical protein n=1 Tax=Halobaculum sp. MBLA0147 TaxID=3079934 RepID=UPI0035247CA2